MTFVWMFITAFVVLAAWKIGRMLGRHEERKKNQKTRAELEEIFVKPLQKRKISLLGGHAHGLTVHYSEAELKLHNYRLLVTATKDGRDFEELYEIQGDLGIHLEEVER